MSMRNYWSEHDGPQPTAEEELRESGKRSLIGLVCAPAAVLVILWSLSRLLS